MANDCEFVIPERIAEGDMLFRVTSDSTIELIDSLDKSSSASFSPK
jgi:hypothetical protein